MILFLFGLFPHVYLTVSFITIKTRTPSSMNMQPQYDTNGTWNDIDAQLKHPGSVENKCY